MRLIEELIEKAKLTPKVVALSECESPDTIVLARALVDRGIAKPLLVSPRTVIGETAAKAGVPIADIPVFDTGDAAALQMLLETAYPLAPPKFTFEEFSEKFGDPMGCAMMLETTGKAECSFQGHVHSTAAVLMHALRVIGLKDGIKTASLFALMETPGFVGSEGDALVFADCALTPEPDAERLSSIAISTADQVRSILGWEPRVAFISFSTYGSGEAPGLTKIRDALRLTRAARPDILCDGELQVDAALIPAVAQKKCAGGGGDKSGVAGRANVLIFPDLNSANIGIKLCQILAGSTGIGHTLSGFKKPVADSSRGATIEDMIGDIALLELAPEA